MRLVEQDPCFKSAMPDEPAFILLARDESAPKLVRQWAAIRQSLISAGLKPKSDQQQIDEAFVLAEQMEAWRRDADEAWRKQAAFDFAAGTHDAFHDAVLHGTGATQGGEHVPAEKLWEVHPEDLAETPYPPPAVDRMHEHGNVERAHLLQHQGDEYFCPRCAKRWGTDEPAPHCV